jgi:hypothetical protein
MLSRSQRREPVVDEQADIPLAVWSMRKAGGELDGGSLELLAWRRKEEEEIEALESEGGSWALPRTKNNRVEDAIPIDLFVAS